MTGRTGSVATVALLLSLAGCMAGSTSSNPASAQRRSTEGHGSTVVGTKPAAAPAQIDTQTLPCGGSIDDQPPPHDWQVVLGVVALPTSPKAAALQTGSTGEPAPALRLFAKTGLVIKAGVTFELVAPSLHDNRVAIGWGGSPSIPSRRVVVTTCADVGGTGWLAYPGGYWLDQVGCIPLTIRSGTEEQSVALGLGAPCAGQRPPQGPSDR